MRYTAIAYTLLDSTVYSPVARRRAAGSLLIYEMRLL